MRLFPAGVEQLTAQSFLHGSADAAGALVASLPGEHRSSRQALAPPPLLCARRQRRGLLAELVLPPVHRHLLEDDRAVCPPECGEDDCHGVQGRRW